MTLGFKQQAILELFKKKKKLSLRAVMEFYPNEQMALSTLKTLELLGFIKKTRRMGVWEVLDGL